MNPYDPERPPRMIQLLPGPAETRRGKLLQWWRCDVFLGSVPLIKLHFALMAALVILAVFRG